MTTRKCHLKTLNNLFCSAVAGTKTEHLHVRQIAHSCTHYMNHFNYRYESQKDLSTDYTIMQIELCCLSV